MRIIPKCEKCGGNQYEKYGTSKDKAGLRYDLVCFKCDNVVTNWRK